MEAIFLVQRGLHGERVARTQALSWFADPTVGGAASPGSAGRLFVRVGRCLSFAGENRPYRCIVPQKSGPEALGD